MASERSEQVSQLIKDNGVILNKIMTDSFNIIMNPPYDGSLHLQILDTCIKFINENSEIVCLHPARWIQDPLWKYKKSSDALKYRKDLEPILKNVEFLDANECNIKFGILNTTDLMISFLSKKHLASVNYEALSFSTEIERSIFNKIKNLTNDTIFNHVEKDKNDGIRVIVKTIILDVCSGGRKCSPYWGACIGYKNDLGVLLNGKHDGVDWTLLTMKNQWTKKEGSPIPYSIKFSTKIEAINFNNYIHNDSFIFYVNELKRDVNVPLKFLPYMGDYTKPWTDERFYDYFNIS